MRVSQTASQIAWSALTVLGLFSTATVQSSEEQQQQQSINVALKASFSAAPYLIELLETAALERPDSYFPLLDLIAQGHFTDLVTDREVYDKFIDVATTTGQNDGILGDDAEALSSFKYALSLRAAAPRVEAHFQYYHTQVEPNLKMGAVQDAACPVWIYHDGQQYCSPTIERAQQPVFDVDETRLPFDRSFLGSTSTNSGLDDDYVLYADITNPLFGEFYESLRRSAEEGLIDFRVRYRPSASTEKRPLFVSGYGTELVLKRTDYIVIDDRDDGAEKKDKLQKTEIEPDFKPLTTSELSELGLKTGSYIASSPNPLDTLLDVTSNFPRYSADIAAHNVSVEFLNEHAENRDMILPPGYNVMWMNGLQLGKRQIDPHLLLGMLKRERKVIAQLKDLGLTAAEATGLLSYETLAQAQADDEPVRYYWVDDQETVPVIIWMNRIEDDMRYSNWPPSLRMVLQRVYPGQLPQVRRDIHNVLVPIDVGDIRDLDLVVNALLGLVKRAVPLQLGLLPLGESATARQMAKLSYYFQEKYNIGGLMSFYEHIVQSKKGLSGLEASFKAVLQDLGDFEVDDISAEYQNALSSEEIEKKTSTLEEYRERLGLDKTTVLVNGVALPRDDIWFEVASQRLSSDLRRLQLAVYHEQTSEDVWTPSVFLTDAVMRRNSLITPNDLKSINVSAVAELFADANIAPDLAKLPRLPGGSASLLSDQAHVLLVGDLGTTQGQSFLREAVKFHVKYPETELLIVHTSEDARSSPEVATKLFAATKDLNRDLSDETVLSILDNDREEDDGAWRQWQDEADRFWSRCSEALTSKAGLVVGKQGVWLNGRTVVPVTEEPFLDADFEALLEFEKKHRIAPVTTAITGLGLEAKFSEPLALAKLTSIVARSLKSDVPEGIDESQTPPIRMNQFRQWKGEHTLIHMGSSTKEPTIQIVASIDPASETAQTWAPILKVLSELDGIDVKIYLNPLNKLEELPIKRFYSAVLSSAPSFDDESGALVSPRASFMGVPQQTLFNLGMIVPPAWLVAPKESIYDLDNIKLSSVQKGRNVDAVYELENILIEGHARDVTRGTPPRGAQLLLGTRKEDPHFADTIVMANLGYFQFKANPGYWDITLKPGTRSSKIFEIDSIGSKGYMPQPGDETTSLALMSFQGVTLYPRLSRKADMEQEDVLEPSSTAKGGAAAEYLGKGASFAQSALSSFGFRKSAGGGGGVKNADINIFSVASGHLYERMLNIMMVSVMKHTKHTVKFWFIEQFLSPSFKIHLPVLASHYGFEYEMVTYKWPHWLRGQKEKQREIWGYKILFLDVLFPLSLDKVIFVDADQIVRTDMMDLNKIDLQGAPYGFTPMCDSRVEMEGFRFWKQGYWKNFLAGKPYHISALYVVDLKKFRELAAGDRLRGQYHSLSADPGSLSNLDQDLPNHMQHVLPIFSLDQNWLWCETWCSDEALTTARTIDLCNNPQTKEPKLDRARRQVPEWTEYDEEIAAVLRDASTKFSDEDDKSVGGDDYADVQEQEQQSAAAAESARARDEL